MFESVLTFPYRFLLGFGPPRVFYFLGTWRICRAFPYPPPVEAPDAGPSKPDTGHEQAKGKNALQRKREYQQRYREQNREKLKQREAERRRRLQNAEIITELSTSSNIEFTELVHEPIIDEISANSQNVAGLENIQHLFVEVSQQNERGQSSANGTEITNNYSKFRCHQLAHKYFDDKINEYIHMSRKAK
ncbi:hypothetical protein PV328_001160 [Microctonus aethiopoides]|uniref:Uncharacterized protein n=1 Tax=Microctonus aethiopoides TaxID=144406 RepID=A0AA39FWW3_9HYME|nr:hypothetical protein PV328_001160 [Microctonus aethiopoides]